MTLADVDARIKGGFLIFDCPNPECPNGRHGIRVPLAPQVDRHGQSWQHSGELPNLTLTPSVDAGCWHGFIRNGELVSC